MFRLRLHPTSSSLFRGIAIIAFWGLLWLWFFGQLSQLGGARQHANAPIEVAAWDRGGARPRAMKASVPAAAF